VLQRIKQLGPGILVSAAFIGPGTITTATIAGASYGYTLLWAIAFSIIATMVLQEMSARLGAVAKIGVGDAIRIKSKNKLFRVFSVILIIGAIGIGNAAYEAGNISGALLGFQSDFSANSDSSSFNPYVLLIGFFAFIVLYSGKYKSIETILSLLVALMGIVFFVSCLLLQPSISSILKAIFIPVLPENASLMVVGLIGTTVVPYNLFLHAASVKQKWKAGNNLSNARWDTFISVALGGLITMAILICSAVAFEAITTQPNSMAGLSHQLRPILGGWSENFLSMGFLAAGFTSSITAPLAAAYAIQEILGWKADMKSKGFRLVWMSILGAGILFGSMGFKPISIILFAQVANGLLLPIVATYLLWVMNDKQLMGKYINSLAVNIVGILVILLTALLGLKSILTAFGLI
jgi:Mn2+/Fe2+ NRAMP family transporter